MFALVRVFVEDQIYSCYKLAAPKMCALTLFLVCISTCFISLAASSSVVMPLRSSLIFSALAFRRRSLTGRLAT